MNPFTAALVFLALGATVAPSLAQDRLPRAGGAVATVAVVDQAPAVRRPRAGGPVTVLPTSAELALQASDAIVVDVTAESEGLGLCGRKYCGTAYTR